MERRVLLAFALAFLVFYGFQAIFPPPRPAAPEGAEAPITAAPPREGAPQAPVLAQAPSPDSVQRPAVVVGDAELRRITVETATVEAVFSNCGAHLESWRLKAYQGDAGDPIDLVPTNVPAGAMRPFTLSVGDPDLTERLRTACYRVTGDRDGQLSVTADATPLVFEYQDASGIVARKTFRFDQNGYVVAFSAEVQHDGTVLNPTIHWGPGLSDQGVMAGSGSSMFAGYVQAPQGIYLLDGERGAERLGADAIETAPDRQDRFRFAGIDDHYFISTAVEPGEARVEYRTTPVPDDPDGRRLVSYSIAYPQPPQEARFFVGPKHFETLRASGGDLVRAIHFGIFGFLAAPLLSALNWVNGFIGNYGWSIIVLTVLINLSMFYFRHKSVVSMRKMQEIQPQIKAIQERYKGLSLTDPARQKMNTEVMTLYREKGVNPASGCLPMLMMMPVLIAFYSFLSVAIELRGAPFGLWIQDLSRPDPYFIVPLLMGASMFWQQRITPSTVDPVQQRVMMIMPVMFTVFFLWFPSGLVIYWFTSNLWAISQQYFTYWLIGPPVPAAARPPAERRVKSAGSGRSGGAEKKTAEKKA